VRAKQIFLKKDYLEEKSVEQNKPKLSDFFHKKTGDIFSCHSDPEWTEGEESLFR